MERAKTSGQFDDTQEIIAKRLQTFTKESIPVVAYYKSKGKVTEINAEKAAGEVWVDTQKAFQKI